MKPDRWHGPANKLFPHQVGCTAPPHDFDTTPSDFLRTVREGLGVQGGLLPMPDYGHQLKQPAANFHRLEEAVIFMADASAGVWTWTRRKKNRIIET